MLGIISSVADLRKEPKFESERVSQLVYGEEVILVEKLEEYSLIEGPDRLKGYIKNTQIDEINRKKYKLKSHFSSNSFTLSFGSYLDETDLEKFRIPKRLVCNIDKSFEPAKLSHSFLGVPYLWGGTSDFGFDCSGFTQRLFRFSNIEIPRNSDWQKDAAQTIPDFSYAEEGDLIFFKGHVAIYLGNGKIIHANGHYMAVAYTNLFDKNEYSKRLMDIFIKIGRFRKQ
ncbi:MAG: SH3 domain-containing C40 family peptidase [Thermoplasmata archaeon]